MRQGDRGFARSPFRNRARLPVAAVVALPHRSFTAEGGLRNAVSPYRKRDFAPPGMSVGRAGIPGLSARQFLRHSRVKPASDADSGRRSRRRRRPTAGAGRGRGVLEARQVSMPLDRRISPHAHRRDGTGESRDWRSPGRPSLRPSMRASLVGKTGYPESRRPRRDLSCVRMGPLPRARRLGRL
jgi:hypothetical protein